MKVFVYGTLKRGFGNHKLLANAKFIGPAMLTGAHILLDSGFPVCMPAEEGLIVAGEVYEIDADTLRWLDHLEGEGRMYHRQPWHVTYADRSEDVAWVYIGDEKYWAETRVGAQWINGNTWVYDGTARRLDDDDRQ
jgi:gamma-glutamylaminecyclotransferase